MLIRVHSPLKKFPFYGDSNLIFDMEIREFEMLRELSKLDNFKFTDLRKRIIARKKRRKLNKIKASKKAAIRKTYIQETTQ